MKKILFMALVAVLLTGCTKGVDTPGKTNPPPTQKTYSITATVDPTNDGKAHGSVSVSDTSPTEGSSVIVTALPDFGWRFSSANANNQSVGFTNDQLKLTNISGSAVIHVVYTDSLTSQGMDSVRNLLTGFKWIKTKNSWKKSNQNTLPWVDYPAYDCWNHEYTTFNSNNTWNFVVESGACSGDFNGSGNLSISPNGNSFTINDGTSNIVQDFKVTKDTLTTTRSNVANSQGVLYDYSFSFVHKNN